MAVELTIVMSWLASTTETVGAMPPITAGAVTVAVGGNEES